MKKILLCLVFVAINTATLDLEKQRADMLTKHNEYRQIHQVANLKRSSTIESVAQTYAQTLVGLGYLMHSSSGYGENLYWGPKTSNVGNAAVTNWYSEISLYKFDQPGYSSGIGHFSQIVWKNSKELGCGISCGSDNYCYVVCNYNPPGNYLNQFAANVLPPSGSSSNNQDTTATEPEEPNPVEPEPEEPEPEVSNESPLDAFRNEMRDRHKYYRSKHQVGNLVRDPEIEAIAQRLAEKSIQSGKFLSFTESYSQGYLGKNSYSCSGMEPTGTSVTDKWYNNVSKYDFNNPESYSNAGVFSQLVWKDSKKMGCGKACKDKKCYVYCGYYPSGNYLNEFAENVFPMK